jgi:uncharacterized protein (DUF433 family)
MSILTPPQPLTVPLRLDERGAWRVGNTRVLLDVVIYEFNHGASPDQIVEAYDSLTVHDVYHVIAYYLANRESVDVYLAEQEAQAEAIRRKFESDFPDNVMTKEKLLKRIADRKADQR